VQGKIGNFDLTYAFARLNRQDEVQSDYNDYSFWYDTIYGYGAYWYDDNYNIINPTQYIQGKGQVPARPATSCASPPTPTSASASSPACSGRTSSTTSSSATRSTAWAACSRSPAGPTRCG
jgi:hypothetical protein